MPAISETTSRRSDKRMAGLAWAVFGLVTLSCIGSAVDALIAQGATSRAAIADDLMFLLGVPVLFAGVGTLIVARVPRNRIGWLLMTPPIMAAIVAPIDRYITRIAATPAPPMLSLALVVWFESWSWVLLIFPLLLIALLFPTGHPPSPRWRWVGRATLVWAALFVTIITSAREFATTTTPSLVLPNPLGGFDPVLLDQFLGPWIVGLVALIVLCVAGLFVRFRRAGAVERAQIKWLLYVGTLLVLVYVVGNVTGLAEDETPASNGYKVFGWLSVLGFPVAIGIAILRYRLYDIDVIIRRTLVYSVLTLTLGLVYVGVIVVLQQLVVPLIGSSDVVIVASTLLIAALFTPLRRRIQTIIDRRFYRRKYNAAKVLAAFGATARDATDLDQLNAAMLGVVDQTVQPEHVGLWLRETTER